MKMAITKIDWKETGKKFSEAMNKIKTSTKTTATAIALALWTASCDWHPMTVSFFSGAQWDYESGATERAITAQEQQVNAKKQAFNAYLDQYNDLQKKLVDDNSRGDKQAAKQTNKSLAKLAGVLSDLEQEINAEEAKIADYREYYTRGEQKYNEEYPAQTPNSRQYKKYN